MRHGLAKEEDRPSKMSESPGLVARAARMMDGSQKADTAGKDQVDKMPGEPWREAREERPICCKFCKERRNFVLLGP
jgi:hypothetical protein